MMRWAAAAAAVVALALSAGAQEVTVRDLVGKDWYGLYLNDAKSGWAMTELRVNDDGTVTAIDDAHLRVSMGAMRQDMQIYQERLYGEDGRIRSIVQRVQDPSGQTEFVCTVRGESMVCVNAIAGSTTTTEVPRPSDSVDDILRQKKLVGPNAQVDDALSFSFFDPMTQKEVQGNSRIARVEQRMFEGALTKVFVIDTHIDLMSMDTTSFVTADGTMLEDVTAGFIVMRLEPEEMAKDVQYKNDVIVSNAAMLDAPIPDARTRESLSLTISGPLTADHLFNDARQTIAAAGEGRYAFTGRRQDVSAYADVTLPVGDPSAAEWLKPTTYVQSDDARIAAKAKEIIGGETNALKAVEKLSAWVYENVEKRFSARLSNSLEVLQNLEGDCTEHSMLFIGLARAAGIPAREAAGLIYIENPEPGFYFHQWAKVWVGEWVDVDPTFDQPVADATHIKLAEGDLISQAKIIPIIGRIAIDMAGGDAAAGN